MSKQENNRRKNPVPRKGLLPSRKTTSLKPKKESQKASNPSHTGQKPDEDVKSSDLLEMTEDELFETLLDVPSRKPLPQFPQQKAGRKNKLVEMIRFSPTRYARMIEKLRMGVSPDVAAVICGVAERTFHEWGEKGAIDANNTIAVEVENPDGTTRIEYEHDPIDSIYSRFFYDVRRAVATRVAEAEAKLSEEDPIKWLTRGAGRIFGNKWAKDPSKQQALPNPQTSPLHTLPPPKSPDDAIDATFTVQPTSILPSPEALEQQEKEKGPMRLQTTLEEDYEAMKTFMEATGTPMPPEMKKAYEDQINSMKQEVEADDEDDD